MPYQTAEHASMLRQPAYIAGSLPPRHGEGAPWLHDSHPVASEPRQGRRTAQAWCRKALWKARRTGSLPRKLKAMLDTPPLILDPGHNRLISLVALEARHTESLSCGEARLMRRLQNGVETFRAATCQDQMRGR